MATKVFFFISWKAFSILPFKFQQIILIYLLIIRLKQASIYLVFKHSKEFFCSAECKAKACFCRIELTKPILKIWNVDLNTASHTEYIIALKLFVFISTSTKTNSITLYSLVDHHRTTILLMIISLSLSLIYSTSYLLIVIQWLIWCSHWLQMGEVLCSSSFYYALLITPKYKSNNILHLYKRNSYKHNIL